MGNCFRVGYCLLVGVSILALRLFLVHIPQNTILTSKHLEGLRIEEESQIELLIGHISLSDHNVLYVSAFPLFLFILLPQHFTPGKKLKKS